MRTPDQQDILDALADAAVDVLVLMPDTAQLVRPVRTPDGFGGRTSTDETVAVVACRRKALSLRARAAAATVAPSASYTLTVPVGTDVRTSDALVVDGVRYEVLFVPDNTYQVAVACLCSVAG